MTRISTAQLASILILGGIWEIICLHAIPGTGMLLGAAAAFGVQLLLILPLLSGDIPGWRWMQLLYAGYFVLAGARNLVQLSGTAPETLLSVPGRLGAGILLVLVCLFTAAVGLQAAARCAPVILGFFVLSLVVLVIGAWGRFQPERLASSDGGIPQGLGLFFCGAELPAIWVLRGRCDGSPRRAVLVSILVKCAIFLVIGCLCLAAGGCLMDRSDAPFFTLCSLSQPLQGQRADALYILVFVMLSVMQLTLQAGFAAHLLEQAFPKLRCTAPWVLLTMLALAGGLPGGAGDALFRTLVPIMAFGIPCTILMLRTLRRRSRT